jgi:MFS family permease
MVAATPENSVVGQDGVAAISTAMWVGTAALMVLGIQPILLAALVAEHRITDALLGRLATVEVLAIAGASAVGAILFRTGGMRMKAAVLSVLLGLVNLACCYAHDAASLFGLRFAAGALEGALLGCTIVILTRTRSPDRINGVFLAAQTIPQALAALALPIYLMPRWGSNASFVILAALAFIGVALAPLLPRATGVKAEKTAAPKWVWTAEIGFVLAAITLQTAGIGAAMEYLAELATLHGFDQRMVGLATSGNLIFQVAGAFVVVGIAYRIPSALALLGGVALQASMAFAFPLAPSGPLYVALACAFGLFLLALGPFQVAWLIRIEPTRRVALVITPITLIGWSLGPLIASFWVSSTSSDQAFRVSACLFVAAGASYIAARLLGRRAPREALAT